MSITNISSYIRYSVYRKCHKNNWEIKTRTINDHELVLITGGKGFVTIEGKKYDAVPGILFYFYPGLVHSLSSTTENPMVFYAVHFNFASMNYINNNWQIAPEDNLLPLQSVTHINSRIRIENTFKDINYYWNEKQQGYELICSGLFSQLLFYIFQEKLKCSQNYSGNRKVGEVIEYINNNIDKKLDIEYMAQMAGLSPDYFSSVFKNITGYPVLKYINKCRIDKAKSILVQENAKVRDVAFRTGFRDEFYFSKVFKKFEGISPQQFIHSVRE